MTYDRQIDQVCTHQVVEEALPVGGDGRTVVPERPIASLDSVRVRLNGLLEVPPRGVALPAETLGRVRGPFATVTGVSDVLRVRVRAEAMQVLTVPSSPRISASQLAQLLNAQVTGCRFFAQNERLGMRSDARGRSATLYVPANSALGSVVGFASPRELRGVDVCPGWSLVRQEGQLDDIPKRLVVFDAPLPLSASFAELDYITRKQECRRCGGTGVENDWRYGTDGNTGEVRNEALLIQELLKDFYTELGSNPFYPKYGSELMGKIGSKLINTAGGLQAAIAADLRLAFQAWQGVKKGQEQAGQPVSDEEFPYRLLDVSVELSPVDPTVIFVVITVQNRSLQRVDLTRGVKLPQSLALLGTSAALGVFRQSLTRFTQVG